MGFNKRFLEALWGEKRVPKEHCKSVTLEFEHLGVKTELKLKLKSKDLFLLSTIVELIHFSFENAKANRKDSK